jgi:hypothetical protein
VERYEAPLSLPMGMVAPQAWARLKGELVMPAQ